LTGKKKKNCCRREHEIFARREKERETVRGLIARTKERREKGMFRSIREGRLGLYLVGLAEVLLLG